jgi:hypothetical protein
MVFRDCWYDLLSLSWYHRLTTTGQEEWASQFLHRLLAVDRRHIFTLAIYVPTQAYSAKSALIASERCIRTDRPLDLQWYIDKEGSSEAGNMAISSE